jgi:AcrR family transcriptional regulator
LSAGQRREAILDAAMQVFAARGFHGTSIDDIAQAAGISKALIYEHFGSKKELHASLVEVNVGDLFARLQQNARSGREGADRLRGGVEAFLGFVEERRDAWRMLFRDAADPDMVAILDRVEEQAAGVLVALMVEEAGEEEPREDLEVFARLLSGALQALANWWLEHPEIPRAQLADRVMDFAWLGLERRRAGARWG